jgi:flagellar M-ring protein FliF
MDFLKAQLTRIQEQLNGLSASQKMLTATLVAIMVMTLVLWSRYAAEPEMDTVFTSLSQEEVGQISSVLDDKGITYKFSGTSLMVPADQKMRVMGELAFLQVLPQDFNQAFDELVVKDGNPLDDPAKADAMRLEAKQRLLSMVIRNFPGVANAVVVIDLTAVHRFDNSGVQPSAMVNITTTHGGRIDLKKLANGAASMISGAAASVERGRVNVIIDGAPVQVDDDANGFAGNSEYTDLISTSEDRLRKKVLDNLGFIRGLMVSVTVKVDTASVETNKLVVDPKNFSHLLDETTSHTGGEPGAVPNVSVTLGPEPSAGATSSITSETSKFDNKNGQTTTHMVQPGGTVTAIAASVRVPRSYFFNSYKIQNGGKDPDDTELKNFTDSETSQITKNVMYATGIQDASTIVVGPYSDAPEDASAITAVAASPVSTVLSGHSRDIGVGLLAVVSLFMVSMMVRKSAALPALALAADTNTSSSPQPAPEQPREAGEGNAMLDAVELDDESVKTQQMVEQVAQMVQTNPDAAANLVKRWMNR